MRAYRTAVAATAGLALIGGPAAATGPADEIHYSYGDAPGSVVLDWRGSASAVRFGLTRAYGRVAVGVTPAVRPVDSAGPFREAVLTGLVPDATYHYRIGSGPDRVLRAAPVGSFRWVDVGDTASTLCKPWVAGTHRLIAGLAPRFVTHGGDISEANLCGTGAVHRYYDDQQAWSTAAAFQPAWGNHEYGYPAPDAPTGTPRDSFANYKGRGFLTHGQTLALDTATAATPPGCPGPHGGNGCRGEDWGWFRAGGVLFISYPEVWPGALADWARRAAALMARAQADPAVDFVITYGHRPAYSSLAVNGWDPTVRRALDSLAGRFSPGPAHPRGKYVLNVGHHTHAFEVFAPVHGLTHVTNSAGGQDNAGRVTPVKGSLLRLSHLGVLAGDYDAGDHRLTLRWVCGPQDRADGHVDTCRYGATAWTEAFTR